MNKQKKAIVIGSGVAGLSAAAYLAKGGFSVTILEKNSSIGGRARQFEENGFTFDMGPSWYWMPEVFEKFYNDFGKTTADFYELKRLDPSYRVFWKEGRVVDIPASMPEIEALFESFEPGSAKKLRKFLEEAAFKYKVGMNDLVHQPSLSILEFADLRILKGLLKMDVLSNMKKHIKSFVKHPFLQELLEFPVLFLGALPQDTPALYSLMNYADLSLGTWYPMGGMYEIIKAFGQICTKQGVEILVNQEVTSIEILSGKASSVTTASGNFQADVVVATADYHHIDQVVLDPINQSYSDSYWQSRKMAPSCLLYYIGLDTKVNDLQHHNLFFDTDFQVHSNEIYTNPQWPAAPLFYASAPSKTDSAVAPVGSENLFLLIPVAPGLTGDTEEIREKYLDIVMERLTSKTGSQIRLSVVYQRSYATSNFVQDYHAFKGNAYGLANTLSQTAILKPSIKSKKVSNLYYAGQLTVPGPGLPPSIISGKVVAMQVLKENAKQNQ